MNVNIRPTKLSGSVTPPPSKSMAHRALIAVMLSEGACRVEHIEPSKDITATERCMAALLGAGDDLPELDCGESGSTLRFLIPLSLVLCGGGKFTGHGRLMERPQQPYFDLFDQKGISYDLTDGVLTVKGELPAGRYELPGNVSSQFITGLLMALPLVEGDSEIALTTTLESRDYVALTLGVLKRFGIEVQPISGGWRVPGGQTYRGCEMAVEADWSQAGFWYAARGLGNAVEIAGMNGDSAQGDKVVAEQYGKLSQPGGVEIDVSQCPDLVPPLAAMAAVRQGTTRLTNAGRLRIKESDRLSAVTEVLNALGADVREELDALVITGKESLAGGVTVDSHNDHRIAMMAAIAATRCERRVVITGADCVDKSYPDFWEDYEKLGGDFTVY